MTCRHRAGDPGCSSSAVGQERALREREVERQAQHAKREAELTARTVLVRLSPKESVSD